MTQPLAYRESNHNAHFPTNANSPVRIPSALILANCSTGARWTPENHGPSHDAILDYVQRGHAIHARDASLIDESRILWREGVRYFHVHARNPLTHEQCCGSSVYQSFGRAFHAALPDAILSYGASRNGSEVLRSIAAHGEWERLAHCELALEDGGAHFITEHAAAELAIIIDLERQGFCTSNGSLHILNNLEGYVPSGSIERLTLGSGSVGGATDYGHTSAKAQLMALTRVIRARNSLSMPHEVEWTQLQRSAALTELAITYLVPSIAESGRLNVTILFGFSPRLPFPLSYADFQAAVSLATGLPNRTEYFGLDVTVTVGASIQPTAVSALIQPLDVGPHTGRVVQPLERLVAYACQPDSGVDVLRFGMEDHPFRIGRNGSIYPTTNLELCHVVQDMIDTHGGLLVASDESVQRFHRASTASNRGHSFERKAA